MLPKDWSIIRLEDVTEKVGSGATPKGGKESYRNSGISLIRSLNIYDYVSNYDNLAFISDDQASKLRNVIVEEDDILLNITGASVARCTIVPSNVLPARVNQHVAIIRLKKKLVNPRFLLYTLNSGSYKNHLLNIAQTGATREALTKDDILNFNIPVPPKSLQDRIANILSAYDELIDNNNRRIALLEQMAEQIYKEWFVRFRFPGYESTKFVKGIPEGWRFAPLNKLADFNSKTISKRTAPEYIRYVDISSVTTNSINETVELKFSEAPSRARRVVADKDIIWSSVRPANRAYARIISPPDNLVVSTGFIVISSQTIPASFLYYTVTTDSFVDYIAMVAKGAAYPAASSEDFENTEILVPETKLLDSFDRKIQHFHSLIENLKNKNVLLKKTATYSFPASSAGNYPWKLWNGKRSPCSPSGQKTKIDTATLEIGNIYVTFMIEIQEFLLDDETSPFGEWFNKLDARAAAKVNTYLTRVEGGNTSSLKSLKEGVHECKIDWGPGYRVYLGQDGPKLVILLGGGTKKKQQRDIDAAKSLWKIYKKRKKEQ